MLKIKKKTPNSSKLTDLEISKIDLARQEGFEFVDKNTWSHPGDNVFRGYCVRRIKRSDFKQVPMQMIDFGQYGGKGILNGSQVIKKGQKYAKYLGKCSFMVFDKEMPVTLNLPFQSSVSKNKVRKNRRAPKATMYKTATIRTIQEAGSKGEFGEYSLSVEVNPKLYGKFCKGYKKLPTIVMCANALEQRSLATFLGDAPWLDDIKDENYLEYEKLRRIVQYANTRQVLNVDSTGELSIAYKALENIQKNSLCCYDYGPSYMQNLMYTRDATVLEVIQGNEETMGALFLIKKIRETMENDVLQKALIPAGNDIQQNIIDEELVRLDGIINDMKAEKMEKMAAKKARKLLTKKDRNYLGNLFSSVESKQCREIEMKIFCNKLKTLVGLSDNQYLRELTNRFNAPEVSQLFKLSIEENRDIRPTDSVKVDIPYYKVKLLYTRRVKSSERQPGDPVKVHEPMVCFLYHKKYQQSQASQVESDILSLLNTDGSKRGDHTLRIEIIRLNMLFLHYKTYLNLSEEAREIVARHRDELFGDFQSVYAERYCNHLQYGHIHRLCIDPNISSSNLNPSIIRLFNCAPNNRISPASFSRELIDIYYTYNCQDCDALARQVASLGRVDLLQELSEKGVDLNVQDSKGVTPLMRAVMKVELNAVDFLLKGVGVDVTKADERGRDAMFYTKIIRNEKAKEQIVGLLETSASKEEVPAMERGSILSCPSSFNYAEQNTTSGVEIQYDDIRISEQEGEEDPDDIGIIM